MKEIILTKGMVARVDDADFENINRYNWYPMIKKMKTETVHYACSSQDKTILMHRLIMNPAKGLVVHHIDGDGLNNQRDNLILCTVAIHSHLGSHTPNKTGYKGVQFIPKLNKYRVTIRMMGKRRIVGYYDSPLEAAIRYDQCAMMVHGYFANTNFAKAVSYPEVYALPFLNPNGTIGKTA
jgi:HNH endonuclease